MSYCKIVYDILNYVHMPEVAEVSLSPEHHPIRFDPNPIGDVEVFLLRKPGEPLFKWVSDKDAPEFKEGTVFVVGFTADLPLAVVTIGHLGGIHDPGLTEWVARTQEILELRQEESFSSLRCKVYRTVK